MSKNIFSVVLIMVTLTSCNARERSMFETPSVDKSMLKTVVRYQLDDVVSFTPDNFEAYCLSITGALLDSAFISDVSKGSNSIYSKVNCPNERKTLELYIARVVYFRANKATVLGGYVAGNVSSIEYRYTVVKSKSGEWKVVKKKLISVS